MAGRLVDNSLRAVPLVGSWVAPLVTGGNRRNLALLRAFVEAGGTPAAPAGEGHMRERLLSVRAAVRRGLLLATWPLRRLPLWVLLVGIVLLPVALGAGVFGVFIWLVLRALGIW